MPEPLNLIRSEKFLCPKCRCEMDVCGARTDTKNGNPVEILHACHCKPELVYAVVPEISAARVFNHITQTISMEEAYRRTAERVLPEPEAENDFA